MKHWRHQTDSEIVAPYVEDQYPQTFLVDLYLKLQNDHALEWLWPESISLNKFIATLESKALLVGMVKPSFAPIGFGVVWDLKPDAKQLSFGFAILKEWRHTKHLKPLANLALKFWFETFHVEQLRGLSLLANYPARRFAHKLGFQQVGVDGGMAVLTLDRRQLYGWPVSAGNPTSD